MKLACFPLKLAKPLLRKAYTRDAYAPLLCRGVSWACAGHIPRPRTEPHLQKPLQGAAKALPLRKGIVRVRIFSLLAFLLARRFFGAGVTVRLRIVH
jgi:hypothetical protein